ncbi:hypothetical protein SARC_09526 [Sphaeroforma arctica JP610]|uniref:RGS domain-containing protein n=1 Tax=Sphaeroforma arctica JP610 TaxID=667725 RepID=A0A0L0FMQ8_9EUKA|nr:hypothetical protein SARC_09526 [Sphaeroforma arctica JP610]KNC78032.1 hypothetical protein SARC_09526 [Sphaeroforma arctica JP610]|eukprot:XP_014151934.1 hypothetical protein SARC_09526 [Sphaeroforma arctica JP610]
MSKPVTSGSCISLKTAVGMPVCATIEHSKPASKPISRLMRTLSAPSSVSSRKFKCRDMPAAGSKSNRDVSKLGDLSESTSNIDKVLNDEFEFDTWQSHLGRGAIESCTTILPILEDCERTSDKELGQELKECDRVPENNLRRMSAPNLIRFVRKSLRKTFHSNYHEVGHTTLCEGEETTFKHFKPIHPKRQNVLSTTACGVEEQQPGLLELLTSTDYRGNLLRQRLLKYSREQYCEENLLFLQDFLNLSEASINGDVSSKSQHLLDTYIKDAAISQINISGSMRQAAITSAEKGEVSALSESLAQIAQQTTRNFSIGVYKPFLNSLNYRSSLYHIEN